MQFNLDRKNHQNSMNVQTRTTSSKFPALPDGTATPTIGNTVDQERAYTLGYDAVQLFTRHPDLVAAGIVDALRAGGLGTLSTMCRLTDEVFSQHREDRSSRRVSA